jgi:hypothetical protein
MVAARQVELKFLDFETSSITSKEKKEIRHSMMYSILPAVVQNRIPAIPSLRKSIGNLHSRTMSFKSFNSVIDLSDDVGPPPSYHSRDASGASTPDRNSIISRDIEELELQDDMSERPSSSRSSLPQAPLFEGETGINWKYGNQGTWNTPD